jgi:hypothetical protein
VPAHVPLRTTLSRMDRQRCMARLGPQFQAIVSRQQPVNYSERLSLAGTPIDSTAVTAGVVGQSWAAEDAEAFTAGMWIFGNDCFQDMHESGLLPGKQVRVGLTAGGTLPKARCWLRTLTQSSQHVQVSDLVAFYYTTFKGSVAHRAWKENCKRRCQGAYLVTGRNQDRLIKHLSRGK